MVGLTALVLPILSYGLGLGKLTVKSALDEPLEAEIVLTSATASELVTLKVELGSADDFRRAGVPRPPHVKGLLFVVAERTDGGAYISVSSKKSIKEPFLHFLVAAQWTGGKQIREYTALLDPPLYGARQPAPISSPRTVAGEAASEPATGKGKQGAGDVSVLPLAAGDYGPTQTGDTLWTIASRMQPGSDQNIFQVMVALLQANPEAFIENNINRLKTGKILRVPKPDLLASITSSAASREYQLQLEDWQTYKLKVAGLTPQIKLSQKPATRPKPVSVARAAPKPAPQSKPRAPERPTRSVSKPEPAKPAAPKPAPRVISKPSPVVPTQPAAEEPRDLLRIVRSTLDKEKTSTKVAANTGVAPDKQSQAALDASQKEVVAMSDQITNMEESLVSRELENTELRERLKMLEEQVKGATRLVELENQEMARIQQQAAQQQAEAKAKAAEASATPPAVVAPAAKPKPVAQAKPKAKPRKARIRAGKKSSSKPVRSGGFVPPTPKAWYEDLGALVPGGSTLMLIAGVVGSVLLILVVAIFLRRRRTLAEFEESILSGSALDAHSQTTDTESAGGTDTSFLSDFGMPGMGTMQADEVDPLAEAEVYMAYGRDEQAEEVLKEALNRSPERQELKVKLLEIYQQRNDLKSFETLAEELYPAQGQGDPALWGKVVEMGRQMNPNNPLFTRELPTVAGQPTQKIPIPSEATTTGQSAATTTQAPAVTTSPTITTSGDLQPFPAPESTQQLDYQLDELAGDPGQTADQPKTFVATESGPAPELDLGGRSEEATAPPRPGTLGAENDGGLDFDLDLEEVAATASPVAPAKTAPGADLGLSLDDLDLDSALTTQNKTVSGSGADINLDPMSLTTTQTSLNREVTLEFEEPQTLTETGGDIPGGDIPELNFEEDTVPQMQLVSDSDGSEETETVEALSPQDGNGGDADFTDATTKLDLARAYIDMGDQAGARSIIDEVLKEGNANQKQQAADLASQIAG